jgi:hypothetical protein
MSRGNERRAIRENHTASQFSACSAQSSFLFYDRDANGAMPQIHFATSGKHVALHYNDFLGEA